MDYSVDHLAYKENEGIMEKQTYSFVKLKTETMEKIAKLSKSMEKKDQITRNNSALVTTLVNCAYENEFGV